MYLNSIFLSLQSVYDLIGYYFKDWITMEKILTFFFCPLKGLHKTKVMFLLTELYEDYETHYTLLDKVQQTIWLKPFKFTQFSLQSKKKKKGLSVSCLQ